MNIKRWIEVSFQKEGIHCYPEAANNPALADVSFLANRHRHLFYFYVKLEVMHENRDVEFLQFKKELEQYWTHNELSHRSCEMMAEMLIEYIVKQYPNRDIVVSVYEDNENGAILEYFK